MNLTGRDYFILFGASFILVSFLTAIMQRVALSLGVVDRPSEAHKTHQNPVPYLGGVAIVLGVTIVSVTSSIVSDYSRATIWLALSVLLPAILLGVVGLIDDIKRLSPWPRFIVQSTVALISAGILISTDTLGSPTGSTFFDLAITVFWIVGLTNAINFFDNVDGGASGTVAISSTLLFLLAVQSGQVLIAALAIVLSGATLGFLVWNRPPARIYMGDAGALFLGVLIASLTIRLNPTPVSDFAAFSVPVFLVAIPILDTSVAVSKRIFRGVSPFQGGRDHLSHRLMYMGVTKRHTVLLLWALTLLFGMFSIIISEVSYRLEGLLTTVGALLWVAGYIFFAKQKDTE